MKKKRKAKRSPLARVLIVLCLAVILWSGGKAASIRLAEMREMKAFEELSSAVNKAQELPKERQETSEALPQNDPQPAPIAAYQALKEINDDLFGWLKIEGTIIDYPVMFVPDDPEYYLRRDFSKEKAQSGTPFIDGKCFEGCNNYIIYGHNMKSGVMFGKLSDYADAAFLKEHQIIRFDTLSEKGEYQVIAAFYSKVYKESEEGFRYYEYADLTDPGRFSEYVSKVLEASAVDTGLSAEWGDELITLSTCSYHEGDGRFAVVAKRINNESAE